MVSNGQTKLPARSHLNDYAADELMKQLHSELQVLRRRRSEVKCDIRNLDTIVRGLSECIEWGLEVRPSRSEITSPTDWEAAYGTINAIQSASSVQVELVGSSKCAKSDLTRACRIALMESQGTASLEEIYSRIRRRGSFSFAGIEYPLVAIARILDILAGEARTRNHD